MCDLQEHRKKIMIQTRSDVRQEPSYLNQFSPMQLDIVSCLLETPSHALEPYRKKDRSVSADLHPYTIEPYYKKDRSVSADSHGITSKMGSEDDYVQQWLESSDKAPPVERAKAAPLFTTELLSMEQSLIEQRALLQAIQVERYRRQYQYQSPYDFCSFSSRGWREKPHCLTKDKKLALDMH